MHYEGYEIIIKNKAKTLQKNLEKKLQTTHKILLETEIKYVRFYDYHIKVYPDWYRKTSEAAESSAYQQLLS